MKMNLVPSSYLGNIQYILNNPGNILHSEHTWPLTPVQNLSNHRKHSEYYHNKKTIQNANFHHEMSSLKWGMRQQRKCVCIVNTRTSTNI